MEDLLPFLKKYSDIDVEFIEQFIEIRKGDNLHAPFTIDLNIITEWLKTKKDKLKKTLTKTYKQNIDYILLPPRGEQTSKGSGGHNKELILLTPDTFKMLTMKSKTHIAQQVRYYYVTLEKLVEIYKDEIIKNQDNKIKALERNLKKIKYPVKGALYIIDISNDNDGYKIGKTKNMNTRIKTYNTAHKDNPAIVYVFYTHDIHRLEKCVKNALKEFEYRNNKEYYKASKEDIIDAMKDCQYLITKFTNNSKVPALSRSRDIKNDTNDIVFTTNIEYINNTQDGGAEHTNYINMFNTYKYNKHKYALLQDMCIA